ncbi:unnamed protein product, partial [Brenthis ino]
MPRMLTRRLVSQSFLLEDETPYVTTLNDLKKRREKLLEIKKNILLKQSATHNNTNELPENLTSLIYSKTGNQEEPTEESLTLANCDTTSFSTSLLSLLEIGNTMTSTNNLPYCGTEEVVCTENSNLPIELPSFDFSSDDSVADPDYVPLSEITYVEPIASTSRDSNNHFFPERNLESELAKDSKVRKRKAELMSSKRFRNKNLRMLGQE